MLIEKPKRVCLYSKMEFTPKRNNQLFANKEFRTAYHNQKNNSLRKKLSKINNQLLNNYKILTAIMYNKNECEIHREFLCGKGYCFSVHTHFEKTNGVITYAVYEFSLIKKNDTTYLIRRI